MFQSALTRNIRALRVYLVETVMFYLKSNTPDALAGKILYLTGKKCPNSYNSHAITLLASGMGASGVIDLHPRYAVG